MFEPAPQRSPEVRKMTSPVALERGGGAGTLIPLDEEVAIPVNSSSEVPASPLQPGREVLPPGALTYINLRSALDLLAMTAIVSAICFQFLDGQVRAVVLLALVGLLALGLAVELPWLNRLQVRYTSYSVEPGFIYITRGAVVRRSTFIASHQIQNVETVQGPLLRRFGFSKVRFKCITSVESLGPLDPHAVAAIRRALLRVPEGSGHDD